MDVSYLQQITLFQELQPDELTTLAAVGRDQTFAANTTVIREGEPGDTVYIIVSGSVAVTKGGGADRVALIRVCTQGDFFGEMALIDTESRSANVVTLEPTRCFCLAAAALNTCCAQHPRIAAVVYRTFARTMSARIRHLTDKLQSVADAGLAVGAAADQTHAELASTLAQAMRTPTTILKGTTDLLAEATLSPERQHRLLQAMEAQAQQLSTLLTGVGELLAAAHQSAPLAKRPVQLQGLLQEALESLQPAMDAQRIRFVATIPGDLPAIPVVAEQIRKALTHLLANGIAYNREGGELTLSAMVSPAPSEEKNVPPSPFGGRGGEGGSAPPYVEVRIHDTGPGMPQEIIDRLGQPTGSGIPLLPRLDGGVGLGLALARKLIEAHGGKLWAETTPGEGTTLYFTLPL